MALNPLKLFTSLGLSPTESKVYLANLKLGPTSVQEIAKRAKISRTTTYDAIGSLQNQGLLSTFERGKKKFFVAEDPENVIAHFKKQVTDMEKNFQELTRNIDELKMMAGGEKPTVRFYEGDDAVYALFHDVAQVNPKIVYEVANIDAVYEFLDPAVLKDARKLLISKVRLLHKGPVRNKRERTEYCEMPEGIGDFHGDIWVYEDRVVMVTFVGKPMTVIVQNKAIADTARALFDSVWNLSKCFVSDKK